MTAAPLVAAAAAAGNFLQGWDSGAIAGSLLYIKPEFHLEEAPATEGLIIASTIVGALCITSVAGLLADRFGRRAILITAASLYSAAAVGMALSADVYKLILARFTVGCAYGLATTVVPVLIAEIAPSDIRGQLATTPQLGYSGGTFFAYCMAFGLSFADNPNWRIMTASLFVPAMLYLMLCIFYLPESPRWLVSKGRMIPAKLVLQRLLGKDNVTGELALLVEGLGTGSEAIIEEYVVEHEENMVNKGEKYKVENDGIHLYGLEDDESWIARPASHGAEVERLSILGSHRESQLHIPLMDPTVTLIESFQHPPPELHANEHEEGEQWDEENQGRLHGNHHDAEGEEESPAVHLEDSVPNTPVMLNEWGLERASSDQVDSPRVPLLSQFSEYAQRSSSRARVNWGCGSSDNFNSNGNLKYPRKSSTLNSWSHCLSEHGSMGLGGGWQLAWQWPKSEEPNASGGLKRVFLFPETVSRGPSTMSSMRSLPGLDQHQPVQVAALVSEAALCVTDTIVEPSVSSAGNVCGPAIVHPSKMAKKGLSFSDFLDIRVRRALTVGLTILFLQQFCGMGAILFFTPQILEQSGVDTLLVQVGIKSNSASLLASAVTCLPTLPFIVFAMWLMDRAGRRKILLATIPILFTAMVVIVMTNQFLAPGLVQGAISIVCLMTFFCSFNMGFGAVPNILCSEIFPTRVRAVCLGLCGEMMWTCNMIVTFSFPVLKKHLGLAGVFGLFASISAISWVFVFLKVPETKGFPLEVISEFFAVSSTSTAKKVATTSQKLIN